MPYRTYDAYSKLERDNPWTRAKPAPRQRPDPCADDCTPRCPACGGLQCLCRPRFFPGQLLTDEDLNRLEQYVIEKNKLHNRYLHGWGVACGLEVVCDPCADDSVIVRTGYALSPCGDDIVVCNDQSVDICTLINQCTPSKEPICESPYEVPPKDCSGQSKPWVLAICYDEKPVRGVTARLGTEDTVCGNRCGCGGSGSCGCCDNGNGKAGAMQVKAKPRRAYKPECEPTRICEGFRFIAYPAPKELVKPELMPDDVSLRPSGDLLWAWMYANRARFGPLLERVLCCVTRGMELRAAIREGQQLDTLAALDIYTEYANALEEFAGDFALHRCSFARAVTEKSKEAKSWAGNAARTGELDVGFLQERVRGLDSTWLNILSECFCSALLPACPVPATQNCVPLAVVTLDGDQCRVSEICNWKERKILISWPSIMYWFSWLPWNRLRHWASELCCGDARDRSAYEMLLAMFGAAFSGLQSSSARTPGAAPARNTVAQVRSMDAGLESNNLLNHLLKEFEGLREGSADETAHPTWTVLASRMTGSLAFATPASDKLSERVHRLEEQVASLIKQ